VRPVYIWTVAGLLWLAFFAWYTNLRGPLTADEVDHWLSVMEERSPGSEPSERLRKFLSEDDGDDFLMVNVIEMKAEPDRIEGVDPGETSQQVLGRYMAYMWPALLKRACHPIIGGGAVADTMEVWGIDGGGRWSSAAMMRYRSRRDMLEIAGSPEFNGPHEFKLAAMERTIAFPIETFLSPGDPRGLLGLILFGTAAALHLLFGRSSGAAPLRP